MHGRRCIIRLMKAKKIFYRFTADLVFALHFMVVAIVLFGWMKPGIWHVYMATMTAALVSEIALGYCFLSKWEFELRRKINPDLDYDYSFTSYYTYKLTHRRISTGFHRHAATAFLSLSIAINAYYRFIHG